MLLSIALAMMSFTTSFEVSGVQVILRQNNANNVVAANLYLLGGARQVTEKNAGIEPILLDVSERGTRRYPKNSLRRAMSRLGSEIVVAPRSDWTMFGIRSSTEVFDSTWAILADRVMHFVQILLLPQDDPGRQRDLGVFHVLLFQARQQAAARFLYRNHLSTKTAMACAATTS